jgi:hypothetical protein
MSATKSRGRPPTELDVSTGRTFEIRENMTVNDVASEIAKAFCDGRAADRKRIYKRLQYRAERLPIPYAKTDPSFSKEAMQELISAAIPEISGRFAIALNSSASARSGLSATLSTFSGNMDECKRLIEAQERELAQLRPIKPKYEKLLEKEETRRLKASRAGRKAKGIRKFRAGRNS